AHVDMLGPALLDDDRGDAIGPGASGYGVGMLVELASRLAATLRRGEPAGAGLEAFRRRPDDASSGT
ncbi:MAG: leucyl aminopeptidase family protein, partial [Conexibacter sp.]|nr:leucyl aminopeptidase family protein [Conexibacter sp.]